MSRESAVLLIYILFVFLFIIFLSYIYSKKREEDLDEKLQLMVALKTKELETQYLKKIKDANFLIDLGKLAAGLAHDIRCPLTIISLILQKAQKNNNVVVDLQQAFLEINKIDELSRISVCKMSDKPQKDFFNLNLEINKLINLFEYESRIRKIKIIFESNKEYKLYSDRLKLIQVLSNLILNAMESYDGLKVEIKYIFIKLDMKPRNLFIRIKDYGVGISKENLEKIFDPGFSSKNSAIALGYGLYLSQELMQKTYLSKIKVESKINHGSTFSLPVKKRFVLGEEKKVRKI